MRLITESAVFWTRQKLAYLGLFHSSRQIRWHDHAWKAKRWHETEDISRTSSSARRCGYRRWSVQASMTSQLVTDALIMALHRRGRLRRVLRHCDQGNQYTSEQFPMLMADAGMVCSMSRRGDCWDNAAMESFFSTLKTERLSRRTHRSRNQ